MVPAIRALRGSSIRPISPPALKSVFAEMHIFELTQRAFPPRSDVSLVVRRDRIVGSVLDLGTRWEIPEIYGQ
jgi:hypothetical protein